MVDWLNTLSGFDMSIHGWIALALGSVAVAAFNGGLMWLVIISNRRGHDSAVDDQHAYRPAPPNLPKE